MIGQELHDTVHSALLRRQTVSELWDDPITNGYVALIFLSHPAKDEITINQVISYFERNIVLPDFGSDPKNLAALTLFAAILGETGQKKKANDIIVGTIKQVEELGNKPLTKYSFLNSGELLYFFIVGVKKVRNFEILIRNQILMTKIQEGIAKSDVQNIQRVTFFLSAAIEVELDVKSELDTFLTKLNIGTIQIYEIVPLMWFLIRYKEKLNEILKDEPRLKGLISEHSQAIWDQFEVQKSHLSFNQPSIIEESTSDSVYVLSVFELAMLDDLLNSLFLVRGVYPPTLYYSVNLHPVIQKKTEKLFKEANYNQAIYEAYMVLIDMVKDKSGHPKGSDGKELDGTKLMQNVFSPDSPVLKFNGMRDQTEVDEQRGLMLLFTGSVTAIRNVFFHKSRDDQEDPFSTIEYLQLASLLARKLDSAK